MGKSLIVTGGAGFIGSNFLYYWAERHPQDRLICVDSLTYAGNMKTLEPLMERDNFRFVKGDICDPAIGEVFEEELPDYLVNFAAESHVDRSIEDSGPFLRTNIMGTANLMDQCRKFGIGRFHQVSTDEVYGDLPLECPELKFTEDSPLCASSPYSSSKAGADLLVMAYYRTYGLPASISRSTNNYGPYQFPEKLIPLMVINGMEGRKLPVYGEGKNVRDWLHVWDHCAAIETILLHGDEGEVYNVGGNNERSNIEIVQMLCQQLKLPKSRIDHVRDRMGHDLRYAIQADKIRRLGWAPTIPFEKGLRDTVNWYLEHRDWWEPIVNGEYREYYKQMYAGR